MQKSILYLVLAIPFIFSCGRSGQQDTLEKIKSQRKIKVGYISYFDITYKDGNSGDTKGFLVDVLVEALKNLDIPKENIDFIETDWANFSLGLQSGNYDLSIAGTFNTPVRAKAVNFSRPIFYLGNGAVVKKDDNRFHDIGELNKKDVKIAVVQGEQGYEYARKNLTNASLIALSGSDLSLAPLEVKLGKADAALSDQYVLRRYCDKNPEVKDALKDNPYDVLPICWSVSKDAKDSSLLNYINRELNTMEETGELQKIIDKYPMIPFVKAPVK
jgi:polar amino acid transport system substrate-binding protein